MPSGQSHLTRCARLVLTLDYARVVDNKQGSCYVLHFVVSLTGIVRQHPEAAMAGDALKAECSDLPLPTISEGCILTHSH